MGAAVLPRPGRNCCKTSGHLGKLLSQASSRVSCGSEHDQQVHHPSKSDASGSISCIALMHFPNQMCPMTPMCHVKKCNWGRKSLPYTESKLLNWWQGLSWLSHRRCSSLREAHFLVKLASCSLRRHWEVQWDVNSHPLILGLKWGVSQSCLPTFESQMPTSKSKPLWIHSF